MAKPGEFEIIEKYMAPLSGEGSFGLQDDAAILTPSKGCSIVITQDAIAEGIHFLADDPADKIARKALRVNLSDLAAKGASPKSFSLALVLGQQWDEAWLSEFARGLREDCNQFGISLSGGDTFRTGAGTVISVTVLGEIRKGAYVSRLGARPGDLLYVSGTIGDGALGLLARQGLLRALPPQHEQNLIARYQIPEPRMELAPLLRKYATAAMDVSDGLVGDLEKLVRASEVSTKIQLSDIPFSEAVADCAGVESNHAKTAITGGDDYEILFTIEAQFRQQFEESAKSLPFRVTAIGEISQGEGITVFDFAGRVMEFSSTGYNHSESDQ